MNKQKILIIGSIGREHAIGWKVAQSPLAGKIYFAPGNAGTAKLGINIDISATDIPGLVEFAKKEKIDLTLPLPDDPLALGIVDEFQRAGLRIWGPTKAAAQIEWSKAYSKDFMQRHNLPTAKFEIFNDYKMALEYVKKQSLPVVIKASGLALGKGVVIAKTLEEANMALENMMVKKVFGNSGNEIVIEEFLVGGEISIHVFSDGKNYKVFPTSQDHKPIYDGGMGPNTGGMGTISPVPFVDDQFLETIEKIIVKPTLAQLSLSGAPFVGVLYPGLILTPDGPKILEFNARFGDPETQSYMRLLKTDLLEIFIACAEGRLNEINIEWENQSACCIVLASGGYPGEYKKGLPITGIDAAEQIPGVVIFHAGTKTDGNGTLVTNGGRVLGVSAVGPTLQSALDTAYQGVACISFEGMHYRRDIGQKSFNKK